MNRSHLRQCRWTRMTCCLCLCSLVGSALRFAGFTQALGLGVEGPCIIEESFRGEWRARWSFVVEVCGSFEAQHFIGPEPSTRFGHPCHDAIIRYTPLYEISTPNAAHTFKSAEDALHDCNRLKPCSSSVNLTTDCLSREGIYSITAKHGPKHYSSQHGALQYTIPLPI